MDAITPVVDSTGRLVGYAVVGLTRIFRTLRAARKALARA